MSRNLDDIQAQMDSMEKRQEQIFELLTRISHSLGLEPINTFLPTQTPKTLPEETTFVSKSYTAPENEISMEIKQKAENTPFPYAIVIPNVPITPEISTASTESSMAQEPSTISEVRIPRETQQTQISEDQQTSSEQSTLSTPPLSNAPALVESTRSREILQKQENKEEKGDKGPILQDTLINLRMQTRSYNQRLLAEKSQNKQELQKLQNPQETQATQLKPGRRGRKPRQNNQIEPAKQGTEPKQNSPIEPEKQGTETKQDNPIEPAKRGRKPRQNNQIVPAKQETEPKKNNQMEPEKQGTEPKQNNQMEPAKRGRKPKQNNQMEPSKRGTEPKQNNQMEPAKRGTEPKQNNQMEPPKRGIESKQNNQMEQAKRGRRPKQVTRVNPPSRVEQEQVPRKRKRGISLDRYRSIGIPEICGSSVLRLNPAKVQLFMEKAWPNSTNGAKSNYHDIRRCAQSLVKRLIRNMNLAPDYPGGWKIVPTDLQKQAYIDLENYGRSLNIHIDQCKDYWCAQFFMRNRWVATRAELRKTLTKAHELRNRSQSPADSTCSSAYEDCHDWDTENDQSKIHEESLEDSDSDFHSAPEDEYQISTIFSNSSNKKRRVKSESEEPISYKEFCMILKKKARYLTKQQSIAHT